MDNCKSCGMRVQWAKHHRTNSWMIFDLAKAPTEPAELRWVIESGLRPQEVADIPIARQAKVFELGVLDHHATCPKVDVWRRKDRASKS